MTAVEHMTVEERPVRLLTTEDFFALARQGAFDDQRVELIDGVVVHKMMMGDRHAWLLVRLNRWATEAIPEEVGAVAPQVSLIADRYSVPQPDLFVLPPEDLTSITNASSAFVIEVSDSSLRFDLGRKAALYARGPVPEYWVVDARGRQVVVHTDPHGEEWRTVRRVTEGLIAPQLYPMLTVDVGKLFHGMPDGPDVGDKPPRIER